MKISESPELWKIWSSIDTHKNATENLSLDLLQYMADLAPELLLEFAKKYQSKVDLRYGGETQDDSWFNFNAIDYDDSFEKKAEELLVAGELINKCASKVESPSQKKQLYEVANELKELGREIYIENFGKYRVKLNDVSFNELAAAVELDGLQYKKPVDLSMSLEEFSEFIDNPPYVKLSKALKLLDFEELRESEITNLEDLVKIDVSELKEILEGRAYSLFEWFLENNDLKTSMNDKEIEEYKKSLLTMQLTEKEGDVVADSFLDSCYSSFKMPEEIESIETYNGVEYFTKYYSHGCILPRSICNKISKFLGRAGSNRYHLGVNIMLKVSDKRNTYDKRYEVSSIGDFDIYIHRYEVGNQLNESATVLTYECAQNDDNLPRSFDYVLLKTVKGYQVNVSLGGYINPISNNWLIDEFEALRHDLIKQFNLPLKM